MEFSSGNATVSSGILRFSYYIYVVLFKYFLQQNWNTPKWENQRSLAKLFFTIFFWAPLISHKQRGPAKPIKA